MTKSEAKAKRQAGIQDAISRLAGLFEYGHLLAETDPASLLNNASDEIERLRKVHQASEARRAQRQTVR